MRPAGAFIALAMGIVEFVNPASVGAQEDSKPALSARGGLLERSRHSQFEVFFYTTGLRVFPQDAAGVPLDAAKLTGTATFYHPNSPKPWFSRPLGGTRAAPGQSASLDLVIGLSTVPPTGAKVTFEVAGLPDSAEPTVTFTVPFEFVKAPRESPVAHPTPPQGGVASSPRYVYDPGFYGFGYYPYPGPEIALPHRSGPTASLSGYGQVQLANSGTPLPYVSGHEVFILPSTGGSSVLGVPAWHFTPGSAVPARHDWTTGRDVPLVKPWLRPMD